MILIIFVRHSNVFSFCIPCLFIMLLTKDWAEIWGSHQIKFLKLYSILCYNCWVSQHRHLLLLTTDITLLSCWDVLLFFFSWMKSVPFGQNKFVPKLSFGDLLHCFTLWIAYMPISKTITILRKIGKSCVQKIPSCDLIHICVWKAVLRPSGSNLTDQIHQTQLRLWFEKIFILLMSKSRLTF